MALTYTTIAAVGRRLKGRLGVQSLPGGYGPAVLDDELIDQVGEQVEARINARLRSLYKIPLQSSHPVLASITEKLIVCELMSSQALGEEQLLVGSNGQARGDRSYAGVMCAQGAAELDLLLSGQVSLDGETLATGEEATPTSSRNVSLASKRTPGVAEAVEW